MILKQTTKLFKLRKNIIKRKYNNTRQEKYPAIEFRSIVERNNEIYKDKNIRSILLYGSEMWKLWEIQTILVEIYTQRLKWYGYTKSIEDKRWPRKHWKQQERRKRKTATEWNSQIEKDKVNSWKKLCGVIGIYSAWDARNGHWHFLD